jgi:transposase
LRHHRQHRLLDCAAPSRLIEGRLPTEATVAQVLVSKYADHLPLYRRLRFTPGRTSTSTVRPGRLGWPAAFILQPVHERRMTSLKASSKLFADENTAPQRAQLTAAALATVTGTPNTTPDAAG